MKKISIPLFLILIQLILPFRAAQSLQADTGRIEILNRAGDPVMKITDGDLVQLRLVLPEKASQSSEISFRLSMPESSVAECTIDVGETTCESDAFRSLGWFWGQDGTPRPAREIQAVSNTLLVPVTTSLQIAPRPVVLVHGFISNFQAWKHYLGADGFLASLGLEGFAVGDGQATGVLNTGSLTTPAQRTNTIAQNADILRAYIEEVKKRTGAEQVDLIGHSMGGMISRLYIDRLMQERDIAQLIMLGTPSLGSDCAVLPSALGFYMPTVLEIRTSYMKGIFNRQVTHRHGIPFSAVAGTLIQDSLGSPCTDVPNDSVVSLHSVSDIQLPFETIPLLHTELNTSDQVFQDFVKPLLQKLPGAFPEEADPQLAESDSAALQFTRVYAGHVPAGGQQEVSIPIEAGLTVANFALFDLSNSLNVVVRGASGNVITLDPVKNGLIRIDNPDTLVQLGYGFTNPKPGVWKVTLEATEKTPSQGADFALTAYFMGGASIEGNTSTLLPLINDPVQLSARLELGGQPVTIDKAEALIRGPEGKVENLPLTPQGSQAEATWIPDTAGPYGIDLQVTGKLSDGTTIERTAFLAVEAQPGQSQIRLSLLLSAIGLGALCLGLAILGVLLLVLLRRRKQARSKSR